MEIAKTVDEIIRVHLTARCPLLYLVSYEEDRVLSKLLSITKTLFSKT